MLEELRDHVAAKIGAIAKPANIVFTPELPKTRSGKIMRRLLRDVAEHRRLGDTTTLADPAVVDEIAERARRLPADDGRRGLGSGHRGRERGDGAVDVALGRPPRRDGEPDRRRPSHSVPLIQASPLACTAASARVRRASSAKRKSTWLSTTSLSTSQPGSSAIPAAKRRARAHERSTRSATPERPSWRSAA